MLQNITQRRRGAEFQYFMKLLDSVVASPLRERPASHRPKRAEKATLKDQCLCGVIFGKVLILLAFL